MNIALWIVAGVLAAAFTAAGIPKLVVPRERLAEKMAWVTDATDAQVKLVGGLEGLAAAAPAIVLGLLCVFVAWGRFGPHAF